MHFIADMHISPLTVEELLKAGYSIIRVTDKLPATASDKDIVQLAYHEKAAIITQDLDFSAIVAQSGLQGPSIISLRVADAKPHAITAILKAVLPLVEADIVDGSLISIDEEEYRIRRLPVR
jgi:predicted nuclease of predicted toxin-antitoxin system